MMSGVYLRLGRSAESDLKLAAAARFYRAALAAAREAALAAEAEMGLLRTQTELAEKKKHVELLSAFVAKYPTAPRTLDAVVGLAGLAEALPVDKQALLRSSFQLRAAAIAQKDARALSRLAPVFQKLGDTESARDAEKTAKSLEAAGSSIASGSPPPAGPFGFLDPLSAQGPQGFRFPSPKDFPPEMRAQFEAMQFELRLGRQLSEPCKGLPRREAQTYVRLYIKGARLERAVVLDPEAGAELKACLAAAAAKVRAFPASFGDHRDVQVLFGPPQARPTPTR